MHTLNMESINNQKLETPQNKSEQLSGKEKMEAILTLFGTDAAREAFKQSCREYIEARDKAVRESYADEAHIRRRAIDSSPKQAVIHNRIMDALTRLASQSLNISPLQSEILRKMADRDVTAAIIREYVASEVPDVEEDEEDLGGRKGGMSDTAYYHSLGREH